MKRINAFMRRLLLSAALIALWACTGDFADINRNPNEVTDEQMQANNYKVGTNIKSLQSLVIPTQEHMYQFLESLCGGPFGGYIGATVDTWLTKFETYNPSADWRKWPFVNVISQTYEPYRSIIKGTDDEVANALAKLLRIVIMQRVSDSFGPIPYSQVMESETESLAVGYDTQREVYMRMFDEMDEVIAALESNLMLPSDAFSRYDGVYAGNIAQWLRFANSFKLRMAMRLSEVEPETARAKGAEAIAGGIIMANVDNAVMNTTDNRMTLIYNDWSDHRVGADIVSYMNGYNDPRRETMFTKVKVNENGQQVDGYAGIRIGINPSNKSLAVSSYCNMIVESLSPVLWMNAAEATFLHAEWELRWGSPDTAGALYEQAIALSFEEHGAVGAAGYIADAASTPAAYTDPLGIYSVSSPQSTVKIAWSAESTAERHLEQIITQKWIAIFPLGTEAWSEYRRTGYPKLLPVVQNNSGGTVNSDWGARRLLYPVEEYTENPENLQKAISDLNAESVNGTGDNMGTRVWWDRKPL